MMVKSLLLAIVCSGLVVAKPLYADDVLNMPPPSPESNPTDLPKVGPEHLDENTTPTVPDEPASARMKEHEVRPQDEDKNKESEEKTVEETTPITSNDALSALGEPSHRFAVGFNLAWTTRQDYGARTFRRLTPELIGFTYGAMPWHEYWWRAGVRLGYSSDQPEMPQALRIEETDTTTLAEAAITRDWYIVPSLAFGAGYDFRTIKLKTSAPLDTADDRINRKERLWMWYVQAGAGLPLLSGLILIEPTARYHTIQYDKRSNWMFGIEATIGI